ncbi:hypothetical protein DWW43_05005 [Clostridium sp. AF15-41]|uniref:hypothetical protein n=1 Tax=Clostridium sp. AF15-41 TaxID=2292996 RepID=UPI000E712249|nr:hypothetical protein [Clostridium sp. AF15-41]RJX00444.1 hypothetical protein DWW43_05005 [Clostridium sp. AF15-41]
MKKRQIISLALAGAMSLGLLAGCGSADDTTTASGTTETQKENAASAFTNEDAVATLIANTTGTVDLTVWASEEDQEFTTGLLNFFKEKYKDVDFNITLGAESESKAKDAWGENYAASNSDVVQADPAIAALAAQAAYATPQRVGNNYWDPAKTLGQMQQSLFSFILVIKKYSKRGLLYFFIVQSENFILSFY